MHNHINACIDFYMPLTIAIDYNKKIPNHKKNLQSAVESCPDVLDIFLVALKPDIKTQYKEDEQMFKSSIKSKGALRTWSFDTAGALAARASLKVLGN